MWRSILVSALIVSHAWALPQLGEQIHTSHSGSLATTPIPIVTQYSTSDPNGGFNVSYETGNGIKVQNSGYFKNVVIPRHEDEFGKIVDEHEQQVFVQSGSYSYTDPEGTLITLTYIADENGFQPNGDHLPKPAQNIHSSIHQDPNHPENQLGQTITTVPSQQTFQPLNQERPIQPQFNPQFQQFPQQQQFSQQQFDQGRFNRQIELIQERPIEQRAYSEIPQERPIQQAYQNIPQLRRFSRQTDLHQERPIQQGHQDFHQDRQIEQGRQDIPQDRPIQGGHQEIPQSRPIEQRYLRRAVRQIELNQNRPIEHGGRLDIPQDRPIQQGHQDIPQERPIDGGLQESSQNRPSGQRYRRRVVRQIELNQDRPIEQSGWQDIPQGKPIQQRYQDIPQERPIEGGLHESTQSRPSGQRYQGGLDVSITAQGGYQESHHSYPSQTVHEEVQAYPSQQKPYDHRAIQTYPYQQH